MLCLVLMSVSVILVLYWCRVVRLVYWFRCCLNWCGWSMVELCWIGRCFCFWIFFRMFFRNLNCLCRCVGRY